MKCICGNDLFYIKHVSCCSECDQNGATLDGEYIYDLKIIDEKDLERDSVRDNGECLMGRAYGEGCHTYICSKCKMTDHLPFVET